jgi:hypothetical protein
MLNLEWHSNVSVCRPSRGFDSFFGCIPMTYVMGYILSPLIRGSA